MLIERQVLILQSIVENFITTNQPVGSKQLAQNIDFSPATIRNDMSKLEKEGLIKKTHISSGRVPSEKGYRYYVDCIKKDYELTSSESEKLKELMSDKYVSEDNYLEKNAIVLSDLTDCTAVILAPTKADRRINKVEVILLSSRSILVILVTNIGEVFQQNYKLDADFSEEDIVEVNKLLQTYFYDVDMATAHVIIHGELEKYLKTKVNNYDMIVVALNRLLQNKIKKTVALGGKYNLLKQPDIDDIEKLTGTKLSSQTEEGKQNQKTYYEYLKNNQKQIDNEFEKARAELKEYLKEQYGNSKEVQKQLSSDDVRRNLANQILTEKTIDLQLSQKKN